MLLNQIKILKQTGCQEIALKRSYREASSGTSVTGLNQVTGVCFIILVISVRHDRVQTVLILTSFSICLSAVKTVGSRAVDLVKRKMLESCLTGTDSA